MQEKGLQEMISKQDPEQIYELLDLLGEGSYGSVYKALHKQSSELFAIKIVNVVGEAESLQREISILKDCQSQYIVRYYGAYTKNNYLWLVMEYCAAGSLIDIIRITNKTLNEFQIASIAYSTLKGLEYLHSNKKIHRDIKGGNILLDHKGNSKLTDFGVSAQLMHTLADKDSVIGTPFWMSPEVISKSKYNKKTDIWSLGITCIELFEGEPPYSHIHPVRAMFVIKNHPPQGLTNPELGSPEFQDFIKQCLTIEPEKRPESKDLLKHEFMKKALGKQVLAELVMDSMPEIEKHRVMETRKYRDRNNSQNQQNLINNEDFNSMVVKDDQFHQNDTGTIIEYKENKINTNYDFDTMIEHKHEYEMKEDDDQLKYHYIMYGNNNQNTLLVKKDIDQPKNLDFVDYAKKMEGKFENNDQYIKNHFSDQKAEIFQNLDDIIPELQKMDIFQIQNKLKKLKQDMNMELEVIQKRYNKRIEACENAIKILTENEKQQKLVKNVNINNNFNIKIDNFEKQNNNVIQINKSNNQKNNDMKKNLESYFIKNEFNSEYNSERNNNSKIDISKSKLDNSNITKDGERIKQVLQKPKVEQKCIIFLNQAQLKLQIQKNETNKIQKNQEKELIHQKIQQQNMPFYLVPQPNFLNILKNNQKGPSNQSEIIKQKGIILNKQQNKVPSTPQNINKKNEMPSLQENIITISVNNNLNNNNNNFNSNNINLTNNISNNIFNTNAKNQDVIIKEQSNLLFGQFAQQLNVQKNKKDSKKQIQQPQQPLQKNQFKVEYRF